MTAVAGLISWLAISVTYIRFRAGMEAQGLSRSILPYSNRLSLPLAYYAVFMILIITFFSGCKSPSSIYFVLSDP
jgi:yeast amino acid transporter